MSTLTALPLPGRAGGVLFGERRAAVRHAACADARVRTAPGAAPWWADVVNVSEDGLRLRVGRTLRPGDVLEVDLHGWRGPPRAVEARVVYAARRGDGSWLVGAALPAGELSPADIEALL